MEIKGPHIACIKIISFEIAWYPLVVALIVSKKFSKRVLLLCKAVCNV